VITIEVRGLPAPQGSKRHVGHGIMVESSKAVGPWREAVRAETQRVMMARPMPPDDRELEPLRGPLRVAITFRLPRPRSHYRSGKNAHLIKDNAPPVPDGRPDLDKLVRAVLDGLTAGGAWSDDAQVAHLSAAKLYGLPGCGIGIKEWEDWE
jgi:crossover junction endodeoxyribonuclease RusA